MHCPLIVLALDSVSVRDRFLAPDIVLMFSLGNFRFLSHQSPFVVCANPVRELTVFAVYYSNQTLLNYHQTSSHHGEPSANSVNFFPFSTLLFLIRFFLDLLFYTAQHTGPSVHDYSFSVLI